MTVRASLAAVALTTSFAGVAGAQQAAGQRATSRRRRATSAPPQQGQAPPPQQSAPPPGYAPPPESAPPPPAATGLGAVGQIAISDDLRVIGLELQPELDGPEHEVDDHPAAAGDRRLRGAEPVDRRSAATRP